MKAFSFRLDSVLLLRKKKEQEKQIAYIAIQKQSVELERMLLIEQKKVSDLSEELKSFRAQEFFSAHQNEFQNVVNIRISKIKEIQQLLDNSRENEEIALRDYLNAKADSELMENWKKKQHENYLIDLMRKEEKEIEDLVCARL